MRNDELDFVPAFHNRMLNQQYLLCYKGYFSQEITKSLLAMTEGKLDKEGTEFNLKKKIFRIMVGCLQTICKSGADKKYRRNAIFMLGKNEHDFFIYSGNVVPQEAVSDMKKKLNTINMMDSQHLKKLHTTLMQALSREEISESEMTLIDIARKSGKKIEYDFSEIDTTSSFFSMKTIIARINDNKNEQ